MLLTRLTATQLGSLPEGLRREINYDEVCRTGFFGAVPAPQGPTCIAMVSAGTADRPVAAEAERCCRSTSDQPDPVRRCHQPSIAPAAEGQPYSPSK